MTATASTTVPPATGLREAREYKNFVNGEWVASSSGKLFENRNPTISSGRSRSRTPPI